MICKVLDCNRKVDLNNKFIARSGYCRHHYIDIIFENKKYKKKKEKPFVKKEERLCSVKGCTNKHVAKGYCGKHYQQVRYKGDVVDTGKNKRCKFNRCEEPYKANGYCDSHNYLYKRYGSPYTRKDKSSSGERAIAKFLMENKIKYRRQKTFDGCVNVYALRFDFYIPRLNTCIEYNGAQHYMPIEIWGGEEGFELNQKKDRIKKQYCEENGIRLIIIPYSDEDNINDILNSLLL